MANLRFPDGFLWGVATSAQQIEGATTADGRGESIWDRFAATPGKIEDGTRPDVACDHYRRWPEDLEILKSLGLGAYRFSIAWPRVLPEGRGAINRPGLDFYERLVDGLLESGIQPWPTLYHWDLPQALQDQGGWADRSTVDAFAEYASVVVDRLGDRVENWATHNEPWCIASLGHEQGHHAPGHTDAAEAVRVAHHLLLSHGRAACAIRSLKPQARVGIVVMYLTVQAASRSDADRNAARSLDGLFNRWYLDPLFRGFYPEDVIADRVAQGHLESERLPFVEADDLVEISTPLDFLGVNYYSRLVAAPGPKGTPVGVPQVAPDELTDMGWEVYPAGLTEALLRLDKDYGPPALFVTENGAAYDDPLDADGRIRDERRLAYLRGHTVAAHEAIQNGCPLQGYFVWSLMDNFEWGLGFAKKFGLYAVDQETLERIPKDSAAWFREVASTNTVSADVAADTRGASRVSTT
jgi:beta-glucosidase